MKYKANTLEKVYLAILGILVGLIIMTPYFVNEGISVLDEEILEVIVSALLFTVGFFIYSLYKREIAKHQKSLEETLNYIGNVNLQISNIKSIFSEMKKYPENKNDIKNILKFSSDKALSIVNSEWMFFRIIETDSMKTLSEYFQARGKVTLVRHEISNKDLVQEKSCQGCTVIESNQDNFDIQAYCVIPKKSIHPNQKILVRAIVNNLAMLYLIFASGYYKNGKNSTNN